MVQLTKINLDNKLFDSTRKEWVETKLQVEEMYKQREQILTDIVKQLTPFISLMFEIFGVCKTNEKYDEFGNFSIVGLIEGFQCNCCFNRQNYISNPQNFFSQVGVSFYITNKEQILFQNFYYANVKCTYSPFCCENFTKNDFEYYIESWNGVLAHFSELFTHLKENLIKQLKKKLL